MHRKRRVLSYCLLVLFAACSTIALSISLPKPLPESKAGIAGFIQLLQRELPTVGLLHTLSFVWILQCYRKSFENKKNGIVRDIDYTALVISGILAVISIIGMSFARYHDFSFILFSKKQMIIAGVVFVGYWSLLYVMLKLIYGKMDSGLLLRNTGKREEISDKAFFRFCVLVLMLCWIPLEMVYFPGSVPHDTRAQLNMYFGLKNVSGRHPFFSTYFIGFLYDIGHILLGKNAIAFCVILQNAAGIWVFSEICRYIYRKTKSMLLAGCMLTFYALLPAWWTYMQAYIKDSLYLIVIAWYALVYVRCCLEEPPKGARSQLIVSGFLSCFLRFNGVVLVLPSLLILLTRKKKMIAQVLVVLAGAYLIMNYAIQPLCIDKPAPQAESMTVPLQQVARYVAKHEHELTEEEKSIIDRVVVYQDMARRYNPDISDPIKNNDRDASAEDWDAFFGLWREWFIRDPLVYIEATTNHVYGYLYPFYFETVLAMYQTYNKEALSQRDRDVTYSAYLMPEAYRNAVQSWLNIWKNIPGLSVLVNPGTYAWILLAAIGAAVRKKDKRAWMFFALPVLNILCCALSPVNGLLRYALPTMALMPLYVFVGVYAYCEPAVMHKSMD